MGLVVLALGCFFVIIYEYMPFLVINVKNNGIKETAVYGVFRTSELSEFQTSELSLMEHIMPKYASPVAYAGRLANQDHTGQSRFATNAEAVAATADDLMVSPESMAAALAGGGVPGSFTTVTASGDITMSSVATKLNMNGGAVTDFIGRATLVSGTVTIANTNIAAADRIFLTRADENSSSALGMLTVTAQTPATSWVITALDPADGSTTITGDVSIVNYIIVRQS